MTLGKKVDGKIPDAKNISLGGAVDKKVPDAAPVAIGGPAEITRTLQPRAIPRDTPAEECNRSDAGWAAQPIRIAVMDFRYPTDKEEAQDMTTKGGGSGTLVADLVFDRLGQLPDFSASRGDRDKLFRGDFAGAARLGRQMGVDAVLAGTFQPVPQKMDADGFAIGPKYYELRAGLVDTCTGQLLMRLVSVTCADGSIRMQADQADRRMDAPAIASSRSKRRIHATSRRAFSLRSTRCCSRSGRSLQSSGRRWQGR